MKVKNNYVDSIKKQFDYGDSTVYMSPTFYEAVKTSKKLVDQIEKIDSELQKKANDAFNKTNSSKLNESFEYPKNIKEWAKDIADTLYDFIKSNFTYRELHEFGLDVLVDAEKSLRRFSGGYELTEGRKKHSFDSLYDEVYAALTSTGDAVERKYNKKSLYPYDQVGVDYSKYDSEGLIGIKITIDSNSKNNSLKDAEDVAKKYNLKYLYPKSYGDKKQIIIYVPEK